jgi:hypothetical protein
MSSADIDQAIELIQRLPVRPRPIEQEAIRGYLIRLAAANGYDTPRRLYAALHARGLAELDLCANLSEPEINRLHGIYPNYWRKPGSKVDLAVSDFNHYFMRWCPLCLSTSSHLHSAWELKLSCVCMRHALLLCERCPECNGVQRLERSHIDRCRCGTSLSTCKAVTAAPALLKITERMSVSTFDEGMISDLPLLSRPAWQRLVRYLGQFGGNSVPARPGQIADLYKLDVAISLVSTTSNLLIDWPNNFNMLLTLIQRGHIAEVSMRRTFGSLYRVLYFHLNEPCFQFLRDAFENYINSNWWGIVCKRNRSLNINTIDQHPQLTLKQAADKSGIGPALITRLAQTEQISIFEATLPCGRKSKTIHQDYVANITVISKGCLSLKDAAAVLALPKSRVRELITAGLIIPKISRTICNAGSWLIPMPQLQRLAFEPVTISNHQSVTKLKSVLQFWRLQKEGFVS